MDQKSRRLETMSGLMPDLIHMPTGCAFHPRCDNVREVCKKASPAWRPVGDNHWVACHTQ
jgi:oligopeptide transport system ATP-binding protein